MEKKLQQLASCNVQWKLEMRNISGIFKSVTFCSDFIVPCYGVNLVNENVEYLS